jgi:TonB family protein
MVPSRGRQTKEKVKPLAVHRAYSRALAATTIIGALLGSSSLLRAREASEPSIGSAVDARGIRHHATDYPSVELPWIEDKTKWVAPKYPYPEKIKHHEGSGVFQITLDSKTGLVTRVTVLKSTGFKTLDDCAIASFHQWRWKRGKWKQIVIPVTFQMRSGPPKALPRGAIRIPDA